MTPMLNDLISYFRKDNEEGELNQGETKLDIARKYQAECLGEIEPPDYSEDLEESYLRHLCAKPVFGFVETLREIEGCVDDINKVSSELLSGARLNG